MGKTIALEGGTEMTRLQLALVLAAGGHRLLPAGAAPADLVFVAPEGLAPGDLGARFADHAAAGRPAVLLVSESDRALVQAARDWATAGVVLRPFRERVLLSMVTDLSR